jgi:CHAT domain-containing protein
MKGFPNSDFLHISTDVEVRHENPMFSSIRCSDAWATAIDLYSTPCKANLVTLNRNVHKNLVRTSDSRPAITEALLYAGARSVLTNLWNVDLNTTGLFMQTFYTEWKNGAAKCDAVRSAALALRNTHAHPFFWAPYILAGQR